MSSVRVALRKHIQVTPCRLHLGKCIYTCEQTTAEAALDLNNCREALGDGLRRNGKEKCN